MSLSKQLLILISLIFLAIFAVNFITSVNNIRDYLQIESKVHAEDTATSLGLSISPYISEDNDPIMETMIQAIFDRGYYKEIKLVDMDGKPMVLLTNNESFDEVPKWFIDLVPMTGFKAEREVSSGWNLGGVLTVENNPGYAHLKLYEQAIEAFKYSLMALVVAFSLLVLVLRFILLPLRRIELLADKIAEGKFELIKKLPWTTDVRNVAVAMNHMSSKIGNIISKQNKKLDDISEKLQKDELTGLNKKSTFTDELEQLFLAKASGFVLRANIDRLGELVQELGKSKVDAFIVAFSKVLTDIAKANKGVNVYRFYGSEFALLINDSNFTDVEVLAKSLSDKFSELGHEYGRDDVAHIGIAPIQSTTTVHEVLASANEAYEKAKLVGNNSFVLNKETGRIRDSAEWKELVHTIIEEKTFKISYVGQAKGMLIDNLGSVVMEESFTQVFDEKNESIPIGTFVSIAAKFHKIIDLDKGVTEGVVEHIVKESIHYPIIINLSMESVCNPDFRTWLYKVLTAKPEICTYLAFSVTAYSAAKDLKSVQLFTDFIHRFGAKFLLKRYEAQLISLDKLKDLGLDYIRLGRDVTEDIANDSGKRQFLETMHDFSDLTDIKLVAESVKAEDDLTFLSKLGMFGAS